ncbi:murein hydrolase activator EnvC family protein [Deferribacter abyssi]|uniref:murein hydrolase activator EnvC family protein n=1 Tax=Deferribacter abyssi TaxID=213806 RepID=UPI003C1CB3BF
MIIRVIFLIFVAFNVFSAEIIEEYDSIVKYLNKVKKEIKNETEKLDTILRSKKSIEKKLKSLEKSINRQKNILRKINSKMQKIIKEKQEIEYKIKKLKTKNNFLKKRIRKFNIYIIDNQKYLRLKLLLFTKKYYEVKNNFELLENINLKVYDLIKEYQLIQKKLKILHKKIKNKLEDINAIKRLKVSIINKLEDEKLQQKQLIAILNEDENSIKQYLAILKSKENELEKRFKSLDNQLVKKGEKKIVNSLFFKNKGNLPWPVEGNVVEFFGPKKIKGFKGKIYNKGIKIQITGDGYVYTIFDGEVKYTDWVRGLGNIVIINHDKFFYTLYANIDEVLVKKNQKVKKGDKIGIIDVDLNNKSAYLYFEIRKESKAVDPLKWLKRRSLNE